MKSQELRLGNLIEYKIKDKLDERKEWWEISKVDFQDLTWLDSNPEDADFRPIKLTEEWLLKFGFEFDTIDWQFSYPSCYFIGWYAGKWCLGTQSDGVLKETYFEYVHQLQNLFFCLCGKELTQVSE